MPVAPRAGVGAISSQEAPRKRVRVLFPHLLETAGRQNSVSLDNRKGSDEIAQRQDADAKAQRKTPTMNRKDSNSSTQAFQISNVPCNESNVVEQDPKHATSAKVPKHGDEQRSSQSDRETPSTPASSEVLTWDGLKLSMHDLSCLEDDSMLNDAVIDFFLRLLHRYLCPGDDIYVFSCHFFTRLTAAGAADGEIGWENVKGWTKRINLFGYRYALVPINSELHWWLAVLQISSRDMGAPEVRLACVDSLLGPPSRYKHVEHYLCGYLQREWRERWASQAGAISSSPLQWQVSECCETVPQQENGVDCGVFLLENILQLLAGMCAPAYASSELRSRVSPWCDQPQALHRRGCLRRTARRLQVELSAASSGKNFATVPDLLEGRPEVVKRLRSLWGLQLQCSPMAAA